MHKQNHEFLMKFVVLHILFSKSAFKKKKKKIKLLKNYRKYIVKEEIKLMKRKNSQHLKDTVSIII